MRLGIKGKQDLGVTSIVGAIVVALRVMHLSRLAGVNLEESKARAELIANTIFQRAYAVVAEGVDPHVRLRTDPGLRSILESSLYSRNVTYAAIVDTNDVVVAHADPAREGDLLPAGEDLNSLLSRAPLNQLLAIFFDQGRNLELKQPLLLEGSEFGSIRIGVSTLLIRADLQEYLAPAVVAAAAALGIAVAVAMLLAQLMLRPIHVIRSGLTRLGRGEFGVRLDLNQQDEFGELGTFFNTVSAQLSADRTQMAGQVANLESAVQHLEDAVALVSSNGEMLFVNPSMQALLPAAQVGSRLDALLPTEHAMFRLYEETLASRQARGPVSVQWGRPGADEGPKKIQEISSDSGERLILAHPVNDPQGGLVGIMLIARNLEYLGQVQSTLRYSRKLAALGRLSAGVAHEVKNPLNAMMIHLELLRQQFAAPASAFARNAARAAVGSGTAVAGDPPPANAAALEHVDVIAGEIRRLDEVVQGFLKFSRPEDLKLQPVQVSSLFGEVIPIVQPEAERSGVQLVVDCDHAPEVNGDPAMLRQAFLNLALNACQAMPQGGTLRITCESLRGRRVAISVADTGVGIKPEHLKRIFDLYFTTKPEGSGIGLSMVYRTVQMHDGEIEVQSTPGKGTTFRVVLPQA
jgi:signal transduction histidine kinase